VTRKLTPEQIAARLANRPRPDFPEDLPVNLRREEIARAITEHQVIIVCGETGSGKTTQLPKICLELGRGTAGLIGHTQPRRIAARATATRIAQELKSELGTVVGYKIRFTDRTSPDSYIKLMTDGILLAETQNDALLTQYDTLLIDEAHERSLNIDFLLGYLRQLLLRRPDLKVIITSATLDAERFARHFAIGDQPAPVIEVSGRLYPIEVRYRPVQQDIPLTTQSTERRNERDLPEAIVDAVEECQRSGPGDVLVFLPGEREIREAAEALRKHSFDRLRWRHPDGCRTGAHETEILPLYARQSAQEQSRVFSSSNGRRVVLATNVAETSLTVPGVRYVVDSGLARIKRYSHRNKVEQLQVEDIAQSAANQRAGRCGRVASGVCIRLYSEEDYNKRPKHTEPEVLRSSLAGVILRMKSLHLGDVEEFPFIDKPLPRMITDGYQLLGELGAVDEARELTRVGHELAKLPLDPRIGRMILAARDEHCLREMLIIASALSLQDPRERPSEAAAAADQAHAKWRGAEAEQRSEFLAYLKLWKAYDEEWAHDSQRKQRDWCRKNFLNYLRMREWRDIHTQLHTLCAEHEWRENEKPASYEQIHRALLAGLLGNIGLRVEEDNNYLGARGIKFFPHPGSALAKKSGKWIVAAELVETSRLFARCLARIEPEWLEVVGAHLLKRHIFEPHWEKRSGQVRAWERGTLHGLVLYARRPVTYSRIDPKLCRELFIRDGLVQGELSEDFLRRARFLQHNQKLVRDIEALEHKSRRPDVLVDEALIEAFYDSKIPSDVVDLASFEVWRKSAEQAEPRLLFLEREQLMRHDAAGVTSDRFPNAMEVHGTRHALSYHFDPGATDDGVTLTVPVAALNQISAQRCEWLVAGMVEQKALQLIKTLPQKYRHRLQPLDEFSAEFAAAQHDQDEPLLRTLTRAIENKLAMKLPLDVFRPEMLPQHLSMNFRVIDEHGRMLAQSRNLGELKSRLADQVEQVFSAVATEQAGGHGMGGAGEIEGLTSWSFGELPELLEVDIGGRTVVGFPALTDEGDSVALRVFDTPEKAEAAHRAGLRRLFALELREQVKYIEKSLSGLRDMALLYMSLGTEAELKAQLVAATLGRTCMMAPLPRTAADFAARKEEGRSRITLVAQEIARLVGAILSEHASLQKKLAQLKAYPAVVEDIKAQCAQLLQKQFVIETPFERLQHFPRYLKAAALRVDKLRADPARDDRLSKDYATLAKPFERERATMLKSGGSDPALEEFRWLLEELRVALFAQELRTPSPVSVKRLQKFWESRQRY